MKTKRLLDVFLTLNCPYANCDGVLVFYPYELVSVCKKCQNIWHPGIINSYQNFNISIEKLNKLKEYYNEQKRTI